MNNKGDSGPNYCGFFTIIDDVTIKKEWLYELRMGIKLNALNEPQVWRDYILDGDRMQFSSKEANHLSYIMDNNESCRWLKGKNTQQAFRNILLKKYNCKCEICDIKNSKILVASHIKPWVVANEVQKTDINNGLLLCALHNRLFDSGYISFSDEGKIMISYELKKDEYSELKISENLTLNIEEESINYMKYHRENVFRGTT